MFVYYATDTEFGLTHEQVVARLPHLTFSPGADLSDHGFNGYVTSAPPVSAGSHVREKMPTLVNGVLTQAFELVPFTSEELAGFLAAAKASKNAQINQWRAAANQTTFPHDGHVIACDALSRSDIDAIANEINLNGAFPSGFPGAWKDVNNNYLPIPNVAAFKAMYSSMTLQGTINFGHSQELKAALASATTLAQVEAIVW